MIFKSGKNINFHKQKTEYGYFQFNQDIDFVSRNVKDKH